MTHPRDRAAPGHHLLSDDEDGDEEQQGPKQRGAVVLTGRCSGGDGPGIRLSGRATPTPIRGILRPCRGAHGFWLRVPTRNEAPIAGTTSAHQIDEAGRDR